MYAYANANAHIYAYANAHVIYILDDYSYTIITHWV